MIIISESVSCSILFLIIFCALIILLTVFSDSFIFIIIFLTATCCSNHSFNFLNSNHVLIRVSMISFFNVFLVISFTVFLSYYQSKVLACYQSLLSYIQDTQFLKTIMLCFSIIVVTLYQFHDVVSQSLMMLTCSNYL